MNRAKVRVSLLALLLPFLLHATHVLKNDLLKLKAVDLIDKMGDELALKTGINGYVIATNEHFPAGYNLVEHVKKYDANMSKPYTVLIFAPNAKITQNNEIKGRAAVIASSSDIAAMYSKGDVLDATLDVVAAKDSNSKEDKYNVGIVQGFSELADQIAEAKTVKLSSTLPNETRNIIGVLKYIVILGSLIVFWIFWIKPLYIRIKYGKQQ